MNQDRDHLKLLSIFHFILGGMTALGGCFPMIHLFVGIGLVSGVFPDSGGQSPEKWVGGLFIVIAAFLILFFWTLAALAFKCGLNLSRYQGYNLCFAVACLECIFMPLGTILGVFTLIVLLRPSVKQLFGVPGAGDAITPSAG